jgi:hypothetical protein
MKVYLRILIVYTGFKQLSPHENSDLSTKSNNSGEARYKFKILMEEKEKDYTNTRATSNL